jgi:hypothetical protein
MLNPNQILKTVEEANIYHRISKYDRYCFEQYLVMFEFDPIQYPSISYIISKNMTNPDSLVNFILAYAQEYQNILYHKKYNFVFEDFQELTYYTKNIKPFYCDIDRKNVNYLSEDFQILTFSRTKFNQIEFNEMMQCCNWLKIEFNILIDEYAEFDVEINYVVNSFRII